MDMRTKRFPLLNDVCVSFQMPHCRTDNIITETSRLVGTVVELLLTLPREQSVSDTKTYIQEVISRHLLTARQCSAIIFNVLVDVIVRDGEASDPWIKDFG